MRARLLCGAAIFGLTLGANAARAEDTGAISIPSQPLASALKEFGVQTHQPVLYGPQLADSKTSHAVAGTADANTALAMLLDGTGLTYKKNGETFLIVAGESEGGNVVQELVVTAQKKEEAIQTVPIAISAFTQKALEEQHIEGGFDLLRAIPNVTFSKNNFSGYNFSIRGIGTKAISVTTDPGVAVEFNGTALIRNRLFEQEYFDVERVEVLRGPQGTLHGRNATAGVIDVISAKPTDRFEGSLKAEVGNYQSRRASGFINIPIIGDKLDVRFAGSFTDRQGYDYNATTQNRINGRDLWSGRLTIGFHPTEKLHGDFVWEHFDENDDRSRTGKQLCHRDPGISSIGGQTLSPLDAGKMSQGCLPGSLYDDSAFGTPNGFAIPFIQFNSGASSPGPVVDTVNPVDPYGGLMQSKDLRTIASIKDPRYIAQADVFELNFDFDLTPTLTLSSQTAYDKDKLYSFQDYNRFNTEPGVFRNSNDDSTFFDGLGWSCAVMLSDNCVDYRGYSPGGYFKDPQLGASNTLAGFDISRAKSEQVSQEFRLQSSFSGRFNFSAGVNYTRYHTLEDYFVMNNLLTATAEILNAAANYTTCNGSFIFQVGRLPLNSPISSHYCIYIDPNPVDSINGDGHNYFRSENPYKLQSYAAFGETYWQVTEQVKITAGLRYTSDHKTFTPIPSQVLLSSSILNDGTVDRGYPALPDIKQQWGEFTGRLGVDWKPDLSFTNQTLLYAFYSRGYKGGGANPPGIGFRDTPADLCAPLGLPPGCGQTLPPLFPPLSFPKLFQPEFVNAFEIGSKNTLAGGSLILNGDVFFYDYSNYQVSQIKDRTAVNENFDAKVWGLELESIWTPTRNLRFNGSLGYQGSRIADGSKSIDLMNRTQGNPDWVVVKPWVQLPSNCIVPKVDVAALVNNAARDTLYELCPGGLGSFPDGQDLGGGVIIDRSKWPNDGAGFFADLGGKELPNAPHWTVSMGGQQSWDILEGWRATLRADAYWQSQSWARVYNDDPYDKLHGWYNVNLSLWIEKPDDGLKIEIYAKNLLDKTPITDAFLNSDDSALTTNVFVLDPRLIGFSVTKKF